MPALPSLAEIPEEVDEELDLEYKRENGIQKKSYTLLSVMF